MLIISQLVHWIDADQFYFKLGAKVFIIYNYIFK